MTASAPSREVLLHSGAPSALGVSVEKIERLTGLPKTLAATVARSDRVQGRLSRILVPESKAVWHALPDGFCVPSATLDCAVLFAGAAFSARALAMRVTPAARAEVEEWLPDGALAFALAERARGGLRFQRTDLARHQVEADGAAAAKAWLDGAVPGDARRLSLRWSCPAGDGTRPGPPKVLSDLFERAIAAADRLTGGLDD